MEHLAPILAISAYLTYPKKLRIEPNSLYVLSVLHNAFLICFSAWTFVAMAQILYAEGIVFESGYYFKNQEFNRVIRLFYASKYYEFIDTFLLYLNGKSPIFLQKYHHVGAVLSWHLVYVYKVDVVWMPTLLNSFVHTIMYSYYLGCLLKINQVRVIRKYITSMQLCQFCVLYVNFYLYRPPVETWFNYYIILIFAAYGLGIIGLFAKFYYENYK